MKLLAVPDFPRDLPESSCKYGSDPLGQLQDEQSREFLLRREVASRIEIIRATTIAAEIVRTQGKLGIIEPGAIADLIVVDGDPLKDSSPFQNQGQRLS